MCRQPINGTNYHIFSALNLKGGYPGAAHSLIDNNDTYYFCLMPWQWHFWTWSHWSAVELLQQVSQANRSPSARLQRAASNMRCFPSRNPWYECTFLKAPHVRLYIVSILRINKACVNGKQQFSRHRRPLT